MTVFDTRSVSPLLDLLFEESEAGRCLVAPDGSVLRANRTWLASTGFRLDDVLGANILDLFPETRDLALALHARARAGHHVEVPRHAQVVNGRERWWEGHLDPVPMDGGSGLLLTVREVTGDAPARRRTSADLDAMTRLHALSTQSLRSGELPRVVLEEMVDFAISVTHADMGNLQLVDPASRTLRIVASRGHERWWLDFFGTIADGQGGASCGQALRTGARVVVEDVETSPIFAGTPALDLQRRAGIRAVQSTPLFGSSGHLVGMISTHFHTPGRPDERGLQLLDLLARQAADMIERAQSEEALRGSEERYRRVVEQVSDGIFTASADGRYVDVNPAGCAMLGMTREEVLARDLADVLAPDELPRLAAQIATLSDGAVHRSEWRFRRKDGTVFVGELDGRRLPEGSFLGVVRDVTDRKRAEQALRESEAEVKAILDAAPIGIWIAHDRECRTITGNAYADHLMGAPPAGNVSASALPGEAAVRYRVLSGERELRPEELPAQVAAATGRPSPREALELRFEDGRSVHLLEAAVPLLDADGRVRGAVAAAADVSELTRAREELRRANDRLVEADRRKNEFLAVLSHELRNPLAPIRNGVHVLERAAPGTEPFVRAKEVLRRQTDHLARLVDDLLDVMRISRGKVELRRCRVDLRDVVRRSMDDSRALFARGGLTLRVEHALGPVWIDADPTRIAQVIGNVLHNAQKFTPAGGVVTVNMVREGTRVRLSVSDTGVGMAPGQEERMFEPFAQGAQDMARTTGGLGLGLALVKSLVELHGGAVSAHSAGPGRGTELVIELPLAEPDGVGTAPSTPGRDGASRDVIVIEDNVDAAQTLADVLALHGHTVRVAPDGRAGLALASERAPDVILCDLGLPGMDGYEVAKAVRGDPALAGVQLVALTGYAQPEDRRRSAEAGFDAHLAKPLDLDELARLLERGRGARP